MKTKKDNGFTVIDVVIAVIAIIIFSTLIFSLMYSFALENVKLKKETMAMIYMTEIFENIGITNYNEVTEENINNFIPEYIKNDGYNVRLTVENLPGDEEIIKKIKVQLKYNVAGKNYIASIERMKIKE